MELKVDLSECKIWPGSVNSNGYGQAYINNKNRGAHRVAYEREKGPIPKGLVIDHLCRVRNCVNVDHLEAVTERENILRGVGWAGKNARKTHCPRGHEYDMITSQGYRTCRSCFNAAVRRSYHKRKKSQA